jgi:BolA protein
MQQQIEQQLEQGFSPVHLQVTNESHMHAGPATESHFKMILVSPQFEGMPRVKRHQAVYKALAEQMQQIHALALHTFSPQEWQDSYSVPASPLCVGKPN